jgi:hypothetical protein
MSFLNAIDSVSLSHLEFQWHLYDVSPRTIVTGARRISFGLCPGPEPGVCVRAEDAMTRSAKLMAAAVVTGLLIAGAMFLIGRFSAPVARPRPAAQTGDYFDGLRSGEAQGLQNGRALQEGAQLPRGQRDVARHAFDAGYVAGMNDAFAGYDGGWTVHVPWIITLDHGSGQVVYRISDRRQLEPGIDYYLCPDGRSLCRRTHG